MNISTIVGLKNNIEYSQYFYKTFRKLYPYEEICFVSYGSNDGTNEWLEDLVHKDINVKIYYNHINASLSQTYNMGVSLASKDYVIFLHNDIVIAPSFLENIFKHLNKETVVSYTVVEPPLFDDKTPCKIINDCGRNLTDFDIAKFYQFCETHQDEHSNKISYGSSFFMCIHKQVFQTIGGFDSLFTPMFCEDIDLIWRLELRNLNMIISHDALCYHFVSKTSRFSKDYQNDTSEIEYRSNRNFVRKWGSTLKGPKYTTTLIVDNCSYELLELMEPWCNNIYIHKNLNVLYIDYLKEEQKYTKFNLNKKLHTFNNSNIKIYNNDSIHIYCDGHQINEKNFGILARLPNMIMQNNKTGMFTLDIYKIYINNLIDCRKYVI